MSEKLPYMPLWVSDFLGSGKIELMPTDGVGSYTLLLFRSWQENPAGTLPNDDEVLACWGRVTPDRWAEIKTRVMAPFTLGKDDRRWYHPRIQSEHKKALEKYVSRKSGALKAAQVKRCRGSSANVELTLSTTPALACEYVSRSTESRRDEELPEKLRTPEFTAAWTDWKKHRREKGATLKPTTIRMQLKKLLSMPIERAVAMLIHSTEQGYTGLFEGNSHGNNRQGFDAKPRPGYRNEASTADAQALHRRTVSFRPAPGSDAPGGNGSGAAIPT